LFVQGFQGLGEVNGHLPQLSFLRLALIHFILEAQTRPHPCQEFNLVGGFDDIVRCPRLKSRFQVGNLHTGSDHNDGNIVQSGLAFDPPTRLDAVDARHTHIH